MSIKNLHQNEAIEKLQHMVNAIDIGMLCSRPKEDDYVYAIPMSRQEVDDEGNIWFLFSSESETFRNLQKNDQVSLLFSDVKSYNFLSINGVAEVSQDAQKIDKYWSKIVEAWFEKGREDARIRVLKVIPKEAHYWDNKTNKLVTFFKIAVSAVSGSKMDIGREGDLNI